MSQYLGRTRLAFARTWHHIDLARDPRTLGRVASAIAVVLQGKHKPVYHPSSDCGDYVVVTNCQHLYVTGNKMEKKTYWKHSGRPGRLQLTPMQTIKDQKGGGELLRKAVYGMLPKNRQRKFIIERLRTFEASDNVYADNILASYDMAPEIAQSEQEKASQEKTSDGKL